MPALVYLLRFPVDIAAATPHFILANMALTGILTYGIHQTNFLAIGVMVGSQLGLVFRTGFREPVFYEAWQWPWVG